MMFEKILIVVGFVFLASLLVYLIPQLLITFLPPLNLRKRYGCSWAFITGGSSGIGHAFALKLAKQGFNIVILGTNPERLSSTESSLKQVNSSIQVRTINADLSTVNSDVITQSVLSQLEGLDLSILYFNAGFGVCERISHPSPNSLKEFHTNIVTHQHLFNSLYPRVAARSMNPESKKRGAVLFTASVAAFYPMPYWAIYGATKCYMGQFGESLAVEAASVGIDVVSLYPGFTHTLFGSRIPGLTDGVQGGAAEIFYQTSESCAAYALSAVGRFVRADSGVMAVVGRIFSKLLDSNVLLWILVKTGLWEKGMKVLGGEKLFKHEKGKE